MSQDELLKENTRKLETEFHNLQEINRTLFRGRKREIERGKSLKTKK